MLGLIALHLNAAELARWTLGHQINARIAPKVQLAPRPHPPKGALIERRAQ